MIINNIHSDYLDLIKILDLTLLNENATQESILNLSIAAKKYDVASICVYPKHLPILRAETNCKLATVVNFPDGIETAEQTVSIINKIAAEQLTDEIDYVFPYKLYLNGQKDLALNISEKVLDACKQHKLITKIILETECYAKHEIIYNLALILIQQGWNFLKTSTGKCPIGATLEASSALLQALIDSKSKCGIKISGGINNWPQALLYINQAEKMLDKKIHPSWFRIGSSRLLAQN